MSKWAELQLPRQVNQTKVKFCIDGQDVTNRTIEIRITPTGYYAELFTTCPVTLDEFGAALKTTVQLHALTIERVEF